MRASNYDKFPSVPVPASVATQRWHGWPAIVARLRDAIHSLDTSDVVMAVECYPGVDDDSIRDGLAAGLGPALTIDSKSAFAPAEEIEARVAPWLGGDDPLFGRLSPLTLADFLDGSRAAALTASIHGSAAAKRGLVLVVGPAASLLAPEAHIVVYADLPRWEGQLRQRRGEADNLGVRNRGLKPSLQYKRSFFVDWRAADRLKRATIARWDFLLDTTAPAEPKLITGAAHLAALAHATTRPFRVVPFFDPGPWGGQWLKDTCGLDRSAVNYAWGFDCVPEENSLRLEFAGGTRVEIPAMNLVLHEPVALLGEAVHGRFGAEFPIRFDFLDTMQGGNLSLQVHPPVAYAAEHFGLRYTQDESYYLLEAAPGAAVYLGRRSGAKLDDMMAALEAANRGDGLFPDERFAARFPAKKHDHFLIPAGTLHCSGANSVVLEISATPYIFTFKLWDWNRLGLDGRPRPVNLRRGRDVIDWTRDEDYARRRLINQVREVARGSGWREERTGLHEAEFIETRRHWFTAPVPHHAGGGVNVLNLVEGEEALVESPDGAFAPLAVHYAETFIVPAGAGPYTIRPHGLGAARAASGGELATIKAFVRTNP